MTDADQYDLTRTCIEKLKRYLSAQRREASLDYDVLDGPWLHFPDGSKLPAKQSDSL